MISSRDIVKGEEENSKKDIAVNHLSHCNGRKISKLRIIHGFTQELQIGRTVLDQLSQQIERSLQIRACTCANCEDVLQGMGQQTTATHHDLVSASHTLEEGLNARTQPETVYAVRTLSTQTRNHTHDETSFMF